MSYSKLPDELLVEIIGSMSDLERIALYSADPSLRVRRNLIMPLKDYYTVAEIEQINQDVNEAWKHAGYRSDSVPTSKFNFNLIVDPKADGTFSIPSGYNPEHVNDLTCSKSCDDADPIYTRTSQKQLTRTQAKEMVNLFKACPLVSAYTRGTGKNDFSNEIIIYCGEDDESAVWDFMHVTKYGKNSLDFYRINMLN